MTPQMRARASLALCLSIALSGCSSGALRAGPAPDAWPSDWTATAAGTSLDALERQVGHALDDATIGRCGRGVRLVLPADRMFAAGSAEMGAEGKAAFGRLALAMGGHRDTHLHIVGHVEATDDPVGDRALTEARAGAVASYLRAFGIRPDQLSTEGRGGEEPVEPNDRAWGRRQNRRMEIHFFDPPRTAEARGAASLARTCSDEDER